MMIRIKHNRRKSCFIEAMVALLCLTVITITLPAQEKIPKLNFDQLENYLHKDNDTTYVINFWATWCAPCIKEMPYFEELNREMEGKSVKVYLVSLDFPQHYESNLLPFIENRNIQSSVLYLDDGKANEWIPKVDTEWTGAIPATLVYKGKKRKFIEGSLSKEELYREVKRVMSYEL